LRNSNAVDKNRKGRVGIVDAFVDISAANGAGYALYARALRFVVPTT
jgi:hypothetical protein